jgi:hypothetical protein
VAMIRREKRVSKFATKMFYGMTPMEPILSLFLEKFYSLLNVKSCIYFKKVL